MGINYRLEKERRMKRNEDMDIDTELRNIKTAMNTKEERPTPEFLKELSLLEKNIEVTREYVDKLLVRLTPLITATTDDQGERKIKDPCRHSEITCRIRALRHTLQIIQTNINETLEHLDI